MAQYAEIRFNGGAGALLCNGCYVILKEGHDHPDKLHFCDSCAEANPDGIIYVIEEFYDGSESLNTTG